MSLIHRAIDFPLRGCNFYMCSLYIHILFKELLWELRSLEKDLLWYSQRTRWFWLPPWQTNWQSTWGTSLHNARLNIIKCASNFRFFLPCVLPQQSQINPIQSKQVYRKYPPCEILRDWNKGYVKVKHLMGNQVEWHVVYWCNHRDVSC